MAGYFPPSQIEILPRFASDDSNGAPARYNADVSFNHPGSPF